MRSQELPLKHLKESLSESNSPKSVQMFTFSLTQVAQSLMQGLLLLEDVHVFADAIEESVAKRLQWHTITNFFSLFLI